MRQLGTLKCLEAQGDEKAPWVIFFHGYGADAQDLFSLHEVIPTKNKNLNWLFPDGFLEVPIGPGWTGKAWWHVDMMELQKIAQSGGIRDLSDQTPVGMDKAFDKAMKMIEQLKVPWDQIILGGFSQGSMLATELYLRAPQAPRGLVIMSGTALHTNIWKPLISQRVGNKFFMSHGQADNVLPIQGAQKLETIFTQNGMKGRLITFKGGHEIPMQVIQGVGSYLNEIV